MRKKYYKRSQTPRQEGYLSMFLFVAGSFFIVSIVYYFSFLYMSRGTTSVYGEIRTRGISTIYLSNPPHSSPKQLGYVPFSAKWQKITKSLPVVVAKSKKIIPSDQIIWHGPRNKKEVALTFDADMTPVMVDWLHSGKVETYNDPQSITYLIEHNIKATFFLTGLWIESYPDVTRELAENSLFELENHTYSHPSMA